MRRLATLTLIGLAGLVLSVASSASWAFIGPSQVLPAVLAAPRPQSPGPVITLLNGQPTRWVMADGGLSGMYGPGVQCMVAPAGAVVKLNPLNAIHLCVRPTDGGCTATATDQNYGDYLAAQSPHWVVLRDDAADGGEVLCSVPAAGQGDGGAAVFRMY